MNEPRRPDPTTRVFLVEQYWPGVTPALAGAAAARLRRAARGLATEGTAVRHLCSDLLPADEVVVSMVEARSAASVVAVHERAGHPADRITEATPLGRRSRRAAR